MSKIVKINGTDLQVIVASEELCDATRRKNSGVRH